MLTVGVTVIYTGRRVGPLLRALPPPLLLPVVYNWLVMHRESGVGDAQIV